MQLRMNIPLLPVREKIKINQHFLETLHIKLSSSRGSKADIVCTCFYIYIQYAHICTHGRSSCTIWSTFTFHILTKYFMVLCWELFRTDRRSIAETVARMQGLNHVKSKHNLRWRLLDRMFAFHGVVVGFPVAKYLLSFCISFLFIVGTTSEVSLVSLGDLHGKVPYWGSFSDTEWAMIFWFNVLFGHSEFVEFVD